MNLSFVENFEHIRDGGDEFCSQAFSDLPLAKDLARQTSYWVYDPDTGNYGPGKFVGFTGMTFDTYRKARMLNPPEFDGGRTRLALEQASGLRFTKDGALAQGLVQWAERVIGPGALAGIDTAKWQFLKLPLSQRVPSKFAPNPGLPSLLKNVGKSQHQDGVRINVDFHDVFNPPESEFYVAKGSNRPVSVFFNGIAFDAHYVFEGTRSERDLQRLQFSSSLMDEFIRVFPDQRGQFTIQAGRDVDHFLFNLKTVGSHQYAINLEKRIAQSRQDRHEDRLTRLQAAPKKPATVQVTSTAFVRNPDVIAEVLIRSAG